MAGFFRRLFRQRVTEPVLRALIEANKDLNRQTALRKEAAKSRTGFTVIARIEFGRDTRKTGSRGKES